MRRECRLVDWLDGMISWPASIGCHTIFFVCKYQLLNALDHDLLN
jgi:hypothetical protein